jgi:hypothetical protein
MAMVEPANPSMPGAPGPREAVALAAALAAGRLAIGAGLMLAPERALGALGFERPSEATVAAARLAGVRDLVLGGVQVLAMGDGDRLRRSSIACAAADAGDVAVFTAALGGDGSLRRAAVRGVGGAVAGTLAGLWVAWRLRPSP